MYIVCMSEKEFDLEQSIEEWRKQMLAAGIKTPVPLEELESHLRDDIEQQLHQGISAQAAFAAAVKQLGCAGALRQEFKKDRLDIRLFKSDLPARCIASWPHRW